MAALALGAVALSAPNAAAFGTFGPAKTVATGGNVFGIAAGKLNRDRQVDLLVGNDDGDDHISLLLGKGGGKFKPERRIRDPRGPEGIVIARFNGDKRNDFAVAEYGAGGDDSGVSIYTQRRRTRFRRARSLDAGPGAWLLESADLNRDGRRDLVTANFDSDGTDVVTVLLGKGRKGKMRFRQPQDYGGGADASVDGIGLARMNGDRRPDVVVLQDDCSLLIFLTNANGTLADPAVQPGICDAPSTGYGLALGPFDDSPGVDMAFGAVADDSVHHVRGDGAGGFAPGPVVDETGGIVNPGGIAAGDLDRDGELDVATGDGDGSGGFAAMLGDGAGVFPFSGDDTYPGSDDPNIVELARLNRDRGLDVIVGTDTGIDVFLNSP